MFIKKLHILSVLLLVIATSGSIFAQVQSNQSRLNVGKNPKITTSTKPLGAVVYGNLASEVKINNYTVLNDFYRSLLLSKPSSAKTPAVSANATKADYDDLYTDAQINISNIYPNPANDFAKLDYRLKSSTAKAKISFHNLLGATVEEHELNSSEKQLKINTRNWDNGVYFYQLMINGKKVATKKLIVRH